MEITSPWDPSRCSDFVIELDGLTLLTSQRVVLFLVCLGAMMELWWLVLEEMDLWCLAILSIDSSLGLILRLFLILKTRLPLTTACMK